MVERLEVVAEARSWVGTKYQHQQRMKGAAVDCIGLVIGVARALHLVPQDFDINGYSGQPDGHSLMRQAKAHMKQIPVSGMRPGDVVVMVFDVDPCHFGIVGDYRHGGLSMIHALQRHGGGGSVVEHRIAPFNKDRIVAAFSLPGVA